MTTLQEMDEQPLTPNSLVTIMLKSAVGWDQVAAFVGLTMDRKIEIAWEFQRRPIAATQHPMKDLATSLLVFAISNPATEEEEDDPGWSHSKTFTSSQDTN